MDRLDHLRAVFPEDVANRIMYMSLGHPTAHIFKEHIKDSMGVVDCRLHWYRDLYMRIRREVLYGKEDEAASDAESDEESNAESDAESDAESNGVSDAESDIYKDEDEERELIYEEYVKQLVALYKDGAKI